MEHGFAMPFPAISGADPWTGSNNPFLSPMFPDGARPRPPTKPALSSDNMSPNRLLETKICWDGVNV